MLINSAKQTILNLPRIVKRSLVMFGDLLVCGFTVWLAFGLHSEEWGYMQANQLIFFIVATALSLPLFILFGLYQAVFRYVGTTSFLSIVRVFFLYACIIFFIFTIVGVRGVPRSIGVIQPILYFMGVGASRYLVSYWLRVINSSRRTFHHVKSTGLVYGAGSAGRQLVSSISKNNEILIKGFIDDDLRLHGSTVNGIFIYPSADLQILINKLNITDVLLAIPSVSQDRRREIISSLEGCGVRVRTLPGLVDVASGRIKVTDLYDLDMNDLLGRAVVPPDVKLLERNIRNQVILVTGAGGSIGSELCRQIIKFSPKSLILIDNSEHSLYLIYEELKGNLFPIKDDSSCDCYHDQPHCSEKFPPIQLVPRLVSVRDKNLLQKIFRAYRPATVFHAAAYKHVPLVEQNPNESIRNNVFGTLNCAQVSLDSGVSNFILVSTDKAVRPTNVMGASKRIAELVLQAMAEVNSKGVRVTNFSMVRFGNVLGSSGSVAPLFSAQIARGGPITLTHPEITRYFMTIPEAAQLVIQAGAMSVGGDVFILDMGAPVRIYDLATKMIYLSGLLVKDETYPHGDIEIKITGLRPGEKLHEELLIGDKQSTTAHPKIMKAHEEFISWSYLKNELEDLKLALDESDDKLIRSMLKKLVPGYQPNVDK